MSHFTLDMCNMTANFTNWIKSQTFETDPHDVLNCSNYSRNTTGNHTGTGSDGSRSYNWPALFLFLIMFMAIGGNTMVCLAVKFERTLRNMFNYFLVSLAISDMMCATVVMPVSIVKAFLGDMEVPHLMCTIWYALDVLFTSSTIIHLTMISVDRYMALKYPLRYGSRRSSKTALKIIIVWVLAFCAAGPLFVLSMLDKKKHVTYKGCGPEGPLFVITATVITFYLPLLIMTIMYILTVLELHKQSKLQKILQKIHLKPVTSKDDSYYALKGENSNVKSGPSRNLLSAQNKNGKLDKSATETSSDVPLLQKTNSTKTTATAERRSQKNSETDKEDSLQDSLGLVEVTSLSPPRQLHASNGSLYVNNNLHHKRGSSTNVSEYAQSLSNGSDPSVPENKAPGNHLVTLGKKANFVRKLKSKISYKKKHKKKYYSSVEKSRKAVQVLGVLFVVFVSCYLPFFLTYIIKGTCVSKCPIHIPDSLLTAFEWLGYSGSMLNPFIYHIFNKKFRKTFKRLIRCRQCRK